VLCVLCAGCTDPKPNVVIIQSGAKAYFGMSAADRLPVGKDTQMLRFELNQGPRRIEDFDIEELEAFIQRGRTLQARAMGRGLKALFAALVYGKKPAAAPTKKGGLDWDEVLGLGSHDCHPAGGASR
jgi:hypothetical protein